MNHHSRAEISPISVKLSACKIYLQLIHLMIVIDRCTCCKPLKLRVVGLNSRSSTLWKGLYCFGTLLSTSEIIMLLSFCFVLFFPFYKYRPFQSRVQRNCSNVTQTSFMVIKVFKKLIVAGVKGSEHPSTQSFVSNSTNALSN